jgi:hypothetical protein
MSFDILGEPVHTRCLAVAFTQGVGDSIIFHADIIDLRKGGLMELAGRIAMSGIIHKMELSGAFSAETGILESIGWAQSHVMHEANQATKGECCRDPMTRLKGLVGSRLGEGFVANLKHHFGGPLGCTHVNTLFQELSAFVARLFEVRRVHPELAELRQLGECPTCGPALCDGGQRRRRRALSPRGNASARGGRARGVATSRPSCQGAQPQGTDLPGGTMD